MAERLSIEITGDAQQLIAALNKSSQAVKDFGAQAKGGAGGVNALYGSLNSLAGQLIGPVSVVGGLTLLAQGLSASVTAAKQSAAVTAQLDAVLKSTGGAAGVTAQQVLDLSNKMQSLTNFDDEAVTSVQNILLTFTNVGSTVFPQATRTILDMSTALGQDATSSAMQLGKALNDPVEGVSALQRVGVKLSESQKMAVASMTATNDIAGAQGIILAELEREFGGSAEAARQADGGYIALQNSLGNLSEIIGSKTLPALQSLILFTKTGVDAWVAILEQNGLADQVDQINQMAEQSHVAGLAMQSLEADLTRLTRLNVDGQFDDEIAEVNKQISVLKGQMAIGETVIVSYSDNMRLAAIESGRAKQAMAAEKVAADNLSNSLRGASAASARYAAAADAIAIKQARADAAQRGVQRRRDDRSEEYASFGVLSAAEVEAATSRAKGGKSIGSSIGQSMGQSIADTLRSAVESQIRPTLAEVWQPGGEETRIDEWGRRAATIMTQGLGSEWITQLNSQFAGTDFWTPIQQALAAGDTGTAQKLLGNLLTQNPSALWDKELIKQRVRDSMAQEGIKDEFINTIVQELQAEELNVDLAQVTGAMGVGGGMGMAAQDPEKQSAAMADPATQTFGAFSTAFIAVAGESDIMMQLGKVMAAGAATVDMKPAATSLLTGLTTAIKEDAAFKSTFMTIIIQTLVGQGYIAQPRAGR